MSTNELPLSDIRFGNFRRQSTIDSQKDDLSMEVNWDTDVNKMDEAVCQVAESRHRSFSDPNILDGTAGNVRWLSDKHFLLKKYNDSLFEQTRNQLPVPSSLACYPYSFYPEHAPEAGCPVCRYRGGGLAYPYPPPSFVVTAPTTTCMSSLADCGQAGGVGAPGVYGQGKRHRHSIAGQMNYSKVFGIGMAGPTGLKKLIGGSANSLFSTAVISGSSSAPNLRDMISNTSSATGIGWSGPPSLMSSSGPSSPGFSESISKGGSSSEMSSSVISGDGSEAEFNTIDATAESGSTTTDVTVTEEIITTITRDSIDPEETITTARLNAIFISKENVTVLENNLFEPPSTATSLSPINSNVNVYTNVLYSPTAECKHVENTERSQPSSSRSYDFDLKSFIKKSNYDKDFSNPIININNAIGDKWCTNKEKFLENKNFSKTDNIDFGKNLNIHKEKKVEKDIELKKITPGTIVVKESYIDVPKITRVSKSFHGKSSTDCQHSGE
ncbi:unnamed protein product [Acanthoscelides obtectus]|uniref:Uncharacterized protein n=1 Tax=Acanthoscelides obtectus TaxID=200917 RepID=A0A9P0LHA7_ACAOB|nr:unnamed protein product [Acanthoscelides obtectus]CAK1658773.1 Inositol hexakisphosphate and diphosphoinositol-pentakisphosphate kinase [Acanthoscelides obtectus]